MGRKRCRTCWLLWEDKDMVSNSYQCNRCRSEKNSLRYQKRKKIAYKIYGNNCDDCGVPDHFYWEGERYDYILEWHHHPDDPDFRKWIFDYDQGFQKAGQAVNCAKTTVDRIVNDGERSPTISLLCPNGCHSKRNISDGTTTLDGVIRTPINESEGYKITEFLK